MKKFILSLIIILFCFVLSTCHFFEQFEELDEIKLYFQDPNLTIMKGGLAYFVLVAEPDDTLKNNGVDYKISNNMIARIYKGDRKGVQVNGIEVGSCVVTAISGESKAEAVLVVTQDLSKD